MITSQEIADYNLKRFKEVVTSTNKLLLIFLFTLIYVWGTSIEPHVEKIKKYQGDKISKASFDSLSNVFKHLRDSCNSLFIAYGEKKDSTKKEKFGKIKAYYDSLGKEKKVVLDSIHKEPSLEIDIPTLKTVKLPLRLGLGVWFSLFVILMLLLNQERILLNNYLNTGLYYYKEKIAATNKHILNSQDLNLPFWSAPVRLRGNNFEAKVLYVITKWGYAQIITATIALMALLCLLTRVWWISINILGSDYLEQTFFSYTMIFVTSALFIIPVIIILSWVFYPANIKMRQ